MRYLEGNDYIGPILRLLDQIVIRQVVAFDVGAVAFFGEEAFFGVALEEAGFYQVARHIEEDGVVQ